MSVKSTAAGNARAFVQASWLPMIIIVLAQIQMSFNVTALPVSIGEIVDEFDTSPSAIGTALVYYSLAVAGFIMLGAKLGKFLGERTAFQIAALAHGAAMLMMALATNDSMMNNAQTVAGLAAALLVPTLVVLVAHNYRGKQQAQSLGILAGTPAIASALAFFIAGFLGTFLSWRYSFALPAFLSLIVVILSFRLKPVKRQAGVKIDLIGAVLSAIAIFLISIGFSNLTNWGLVLANAGAPFSLLGLSPAPMMIIGGIVIGQAFFTWSHERIENHKTPLISMEVLDTPEERSTIIALFVIGALGPAVNFLVPLFIQIVQGESSMFTAVATVPYTLAIAFSAMFIVRLYDHLRPRFIGVIGFLIVAIGLGMLAATISNDWGTPLVILSLVILGLGEGSLLTLLFNIMVAASPKRLAGDVGAMRGVANNLSTALGTAFASVVAVGLLAVIVTNALTNNPDLPRSLQRQVNLNNIDFVSNDHLSEVLSETTATPEQVEAAVTLNIDARARALRASFLALSALSLLAIFPAFGLPNQSLDELPDPEEPEAVNEQKKKKIK